MKKRIFLVALSLMIAVCAFSLPGCTSKNKAAPKLTIKIGMWPADTDSQDQQMFRDFRQKFNDKYPDIKLVSDNYVYSPDTFVSMAAAGKLPNVFETWYTEPGKLVSGKFIADVTSELQARGWDKDMNEQVRKILTINGKLYGMPRDAYVLGLYLNLDLFRKAGLMNADGTAKYPKTWNDLATVAQTIKQKTSKAGFCMLARDKNGGWHFSQIAWDFGAKLEVQDSSGKWKANFASKEAVAAMQYVKDLKWKYDVLTPDPTQEDWSTGFTELGTGGAAMVLGGNDAVNQPTETNGMPIENLSIVPAPAGPGGQYSLLGGTPYVFSANSTPAQINACLDFIDIMGKAPTDDQYMIDGLAAVDKNNSQNGVPVLPGTLAWTGPQAFLDAQDKVNKEYSNVDMKLYNDYFNIIKQPSNLHEEEPQDTQDMYQELTKVLQAVLTDKNANVQELMNQASSDFQSLLDKNTGSGSSVS